jgi:hypothetical protein
MSENICQTWVVSGRVYFTRKKGAWALRYKKIKKGGGIKGNILQ